MSFFKMTLPLFLTVILFPVSLLHCEKNPSNKSGAGDGTVLFEIEGEATTVADFNKAYNAFVDIVSLQTKIPREELTEMCVDWTMPGYPTGGNMKDMVCSQLDKKVFLEQLKYIKLVYRKAVIDGFTSDPGNQQKIDLMNKQTIMNFYLQNQIELDPKAIDAEINKQCTAVLQKTPGITASQCLDRMKAQVVGQMMSRAQKEQIDLIAGEFRVKEHKKNIKKFVDGTDTGKKGEDTSDKKTDAKK